MFIKIHTNTKQIIYNHFKLFNKSFHILIKNSTQNYTIILLHINFYSRL